MFRKTLLSAVLSAAAVALMAAPTLAAPPVRLTQPTDPPRTPFLGVKYTDNGGDGVYIQGVVSGSPAERAGIENGDVILSVNGNAIGGMADFRSALANSGGVARLRIRDVRTGRVAFRTVTLD